MTDTNEDSEMWDALRRESQEKRAKNRESSYEILVKAGVQIQRFSESHLRVNGAFDFWPGTGKYKNMKTGRYGRGVFNLLKEAKP